MILFANKIFALGGMLLFAICLFAVIRLFRKSTNDPFLMWISKYALHIGFTLSLMSVVASLFYSEIAGFVPCALCWVQRIFIYPQMILFGVALKNDDRGVLKYSFPLTIIGGIFSLYHNYLYLGGSPAIPCDASATCTQRFVFEFGFMTIPLMATSLFVSLALVYFISKKYPQ
jgi:hypothetical protein